ncbi:MAG: hypothetical protein D6744_17900 [Planctomycetota bacterium]|nr:MAG: hypothetical protein D6744_17900 [Planctomycetota bacterium]
MRRATFWTAGSLLTLAAGAVVLSGWNPGVADGGGKPARPTQTPPSAVVNDDDSMTLPWRVGSVVTPRQSAGEVANVIEGLVDSGARYFVVQFREPLTRAERESVLADGVRLLTYVGNNGFYATWSDQPVDAGAIAASPKIHAVVPIDPTWKLEASLARGVVHPWMIVSPAKDPTAIGLKETDVVTIEDVVANNPTVGVYVLFHADVDLDNEAAPLLGFYQGRPRSMLRSVNGMVVEMPYDNLAALATEQIVRWIEPPLPQMSVVNDSNRARVGADIVQQPPYGLDGSGVTVLVYDGGTGLASHADFGGRLFVRDSSGTHYHSTHVAGTIGGSGAASGGTYRGMAPGVILESYGFEQPGGLQQGFLYTDPGDLEADYGDAILNHGADIANNSIGTNTAPNGFPCDWEGNYGVTGSLIDSIAAGFFGQPFRIVWANGNERGSGRCGTTYHTTAPPACAKNHITVGALNSNDDSVTSFTSWGDTDDGRLKPDISAPGCQSDGDGGVTSASDSGGYTTLCGTSMASPTVCGIGALLLQDYRAQYPGAPDFPGSMLKVWLAHTAVDLEETGPDYKTGYGSVRVQPAIDLMRAGNFASGAVDQGETYSFLVISDGVNPVKVTLAWDDVPGTPEVMPVLVNDLDLRVFDPSGTRYYPWTLNPASPATPAVRTQEDHANNIEQVVIDAPVAGAYRVEVYGFNVPQGPQSFSVAATPQLVDCSSQGIIALDAVKYNCGGSAQVQVVDCDLNTDDLVVETVDVNIYSDSEPAGELLTLTESGPETAEFIASIPLVLSDAAGALLIADGDTITAEYLDANDGLGGTNVLVTATAPVDCTPPVISNVQVINIGPRSATVTFDTDEAANGAVRFGADCATLTSSAQESGFQTNHSISLTGLTDNTTYFFAVDAADQAANAATDDNAGSCYTFTTPEVPDFYTEQFSAGFDLANQMLTFAPDGSVDFYSACLESIAALPTDPTGGNVVSLTDDSSATVTLSGASVLLYGQSYSTFYINSNGNITFVAGDSDYTESIDEHFGEPRISPLWDDLNPSTGGTVSWKQLSDRVAVTWENVPEYSTSNSNTFQVEMFFDGTITLSYLNIDLSDCITGLSAGAGTDPDFLADDFSTFGACGPKPPTAVDQSIGTFVNTPVSITLVASDDGLPAPPQLDFVIQSLPANGSLSDPGAGPITAAPYTLVGGGNVVDYTPDMWFAGNDPFTFAADDGGTPPDGGLSNTATVTVAVGGAAVTKLYDFPMDSDPGWTTEGQWAFGQPLGGGSHNFDPTAGVTGANVYGYNLAGDYANLIPAYYLTTTAIDLSDARQTELRFWRWLGVESSTFDHASVEISTDGSTWTPLWTHSGGSISDSSWSQQTFDISAIADGQPTVYIRWSMGPTDASVTYPGWNIDDVEIWGEPTTFNIPGDLNGDCVVDLTDLAILLGNFDLSPANPEDGDIDGNGTVDLTDLAILLANFDAACP